MSIQIIREELKDIPGAERMVMQYDEARKLQIFIIDDINVAVSYDATTDDIRAAFIKARRPTQKPNKAAPKPRKKRAK